MFHIAKIAFTVSLTASLLAACGGGSSSATPAQTTPPVTGGGDGTTGEPIRRSNIEFKQAATESGDLPLRLDIYQPSDRCDANRPTVLYVHGGSFTSGDKSSVFITALANATNDKGFNFVSINYRLAGNEAVLSDPYKPIFDRFVVEAEGSGTSSVIINAAVAATEDTVSALNWMQTNADTYCLDMSRLAYWGGSAGSYTVLQVAYGLNQYNIARPEPDVVINYWGDLFLDTDLEFREAPFLTVHGDADTVVDYLHAVDLAERADEVGVPYSFYTGVGDGHGVNPLKQVNGVTLLDLTVNFIDAHIVGGTPLYETADAP